MRFRSPHGGWRIGVDLGGTWIRVTAIDGQGRRHDIKQPSPGLEGLPRALDGLWRRWSLKRAETLAIASRGVWTASERRRVAKRLHPLARAVRVISDTEAAYLGALGARAGILLLAGTGSMALGRDARGRWARAGGLGPLLGDEGSAFWIGRQWLKATIDSDGFLRARRILASPNAVPRIAALAPTVLRRARSGSRPARRVVADAQIALADLVHRAAAELRLQGPMAVSWAGGLLANADFREGVWRAARRRGLRLDPRHPEQSASAAVARLALDLAVARRRTETRAAAPHRSRQIK